MHNYLGRYLGKKGDEYIFKAKGSINNRLVGISASTIKFAI